MRRKGLWYKELAGAFLAVLLSASWVMGADFSSEDTPVEMSTAVHSVAINETNFPDRKFRLFVTNHYDADQDGILSEREIARITSVDVSGLWITDLTGINEFANLTNLKCQRNLMEVLNLSKLSNLEYLDCSDNLLRELLVPADLPNLEYANISHNQLTVQPIPLKTSSYSGRCELEYLDCSYNQINGVLNPGDLTGVLDAAYNGITAVQNRAGGIQCSGLFLEGNPGLKVLNLTGQKDCVPEYLTYPQGCTVNALKAPQATKTIYTINKNSCRFYYTPTNATAGRCIYRKDSRTNQWKVMKQYNTPSKVQYYDDKTMTPGISYYYKVRDFIKVKGRNGAAVTLWSPYSATKGAPNIPAAPTTIKATAGVNQATITWSASKYATGYQVYRFNNYNDALNLTGGTRVGITSSTVRKFVDTKAVGGKTYYYKVRPYRTINGRNIYSNFSGGRSAKIKKPQPTPAVSASFRQVLEYYQNGQYTQAQEMANRLPAMASEACVSQMSGSQKMSYIQSAGFLTLAKNYNQGLSGDELQDFYLTDINKDGIAELVEMIGSSRADMRLVISTYLNGQLKTVGSVYCGSCMVYGYPDGNGLVIVDGIQGIERVKKVTMNGMSLQEISYGDRYTTGSYMKFPYQLQGHVYYSASDGQWKYWM